MEARCGLFPIVMKRRLGCGFANTRNFPESGFGAYCVLLSHGQMEGRLRAAERYEPIGGTVNGILGQPCQEKHVQIARVRLTRSRCPAG